jgi:hypothetical protein
MGLDTKTYWLTDRQSQCDFDFDFDRDGSPGEFLVEFGGSRVTEQETARRLHSELKC